MSDKDKTKDDEFRSKFPFPDHSLKLIMDLHADGRITYEECKILNDNILRYLSLRAIFLYADEL